MILVLALPPIGPLRDRLPSFVRGFASRRTVVGFAILLGFATVFGIVNYQRWGDPLRATGDPTGYIHFVAQPWRLARLETYGVFNIERLWYGILYYFCPIWTISRADGQFLFAEFETRMLDAVETPPSSLLLSDPLLLVFAAACLLQLPRLARERLLDLGAVAALMIGLLMPVFLILTFMYMAFRYRMEFYPFLEFSAFLGFFAICIDPGRFSALARSRLSFILIASACFGIIYCHVLLLLYKISQFGHYARPANEVSPVDGWVNYYYTQLKLSFPSVAQRFHL